MRIQAGNHAGDGVGNELFLIDGLNIVGLDHAKYGSQLLQLFQRQRREATACNCLQLYGGKRTGYGTN